MLKKISGFLVALGCLALGACAVNPANGDYTIFGQDVGAKDSALLSKYNVDLQNFIASIPNACNQAASLAGFSASSLATAQQVFSSTLKPKTVANLNNIAADVVTACKGLQVAAIPAAVAVAASSK